MKWVIRLGLVLVGGLFLLLLAPGTALACGVSYQDPPPQQANCTTTAPTVAAAVTEGLAIAGAATAAAMSVVRAAGDAAADSAAVRAATVGDGDNMLQRASQRPGVGPKQLFELDSVFKIAAKYGIDIRSLDISLGDVKYRGFQGFTAPDGKITLFQPAFRSEEDLARTLVHEIFHHSELAAGRPFPMTEADREPYEDRAYTHEKQWWDNQPIRPEPRR